MFGFLRKHKINISLWFFIIAYIIYFSYFTILRYRTLYSSYYDLGIMNQTVFNTYRAIVEKNPAKFLELTDPMTGLQIKRMTIHNDLFLAPIAFLYFIHTGPETLLVLQSVILGLGAFALFRIVLRVFEKDQHKELIAFVFAFSYLLYPPMQRANIFDFHSVTLATSFLLWMIYLWLEKKYLLSLVFLVLSLLSKEQVGLTTFFFGLYALMGKRDKKYGLIVMILSVVWVFLSFFVIIPYFRGGNHFAVSRYGDFGDSPIRILIGIMQNPYSVGKYLFHIDTARYFLFLLGPLGFLSLLSPIQLFIALPEFVINLFSNNWNMRNIIFHYTAVIQPWVFLSAVYGAKKLISHSGLSRIDSGVASLPRMTIICLLLFSLTFSYFKGPLPFTREQEIHPFRYPQQSTKEITLWARTLRDPSLKISATGQVAPLFSSREYLYLFSDNYNLADYVVVTLNEIYNYPEKDILIPVYEHLQKDSRFTKIYGSKLVEVYKKVTL